MPQFNAFHQRNFERWLMARHPHMDTQTIDLSSMWDSGISVSENYNQIEQRLIEMGYGNTNYTNKECKEWEERANEWYQDELQKYNESNQTESITIHGYVELDDTLYCVGFDKEETSYVVLRPKINYPNYYMFLGRLEKKISRLEKSLEVF